MIGAKILKTRSMEVAGISVIVERKKIKNMYIRVLPPDGQVKVSVPDRTTNAAVTAFVTSHLAWIKKAKEKVANLPVQEIPQYQSGEKHMLWGRSYPLEVRDHASHSQVSLSDDRILLQVRGASTYEIRQKLMKQWYRTEMKTVMPEVLARCTQTVGQSPKEWRIKDMRTKWGTCNISQKRIWLNLQLAKMPPECLDYVVTHELVHLYEKNHNQRFYAYMDQFFPNWREVRKRLNREATP